jgi:ribonuclease Z
MSRHLIDQLPVLSCDPQTIIAALLGTERRVLLTGPPGVGKSTLLLQLAEALAAAGRTCHCLSADPGSPAFGVPGAVALGRRQQGEWHIQAIEPLCSLDAGRFRLPLVSAVARLARTVEAGVLLIDGPGVVRGAAGRELLPALIEATQVDLVLALREAGRPPPLLAELSVFAPEVRVIVASAHARRPGQRARARTRTAQWDAYLAAASMQPLDLRQVDVIGTPPPVEQSDSWVGRQVALLRHGRMLGMAELERLTGEQLLLRSAIDAADADTLLLRDACRDADGLLTTAAPFVSEPHAFVAPRELLPMGGSYTGPLLVGRVGVVDVALINGQFGDPLLHVRLRHQPRSLLFDLGDGGRLPAHIAHQVSDVFISHAHMDHLSGFLWLLRSRIGELPPCRLYGPPGLAGHVHSLVQGFLWDRAGERAPAFEIVELHAARLRRFALRAGQPDCALLEERDVGDGVLLTEPGFRVRAVTLDHLTPVLAYAFEPDRELSVRKDRLQARGWQPGDWLAELKQLLLAGKTSAQVELPDGGSASAGELGRELVLSQPGKRLVYATDLADTPDNRSRLHDLAYQAHTLFLEATFTEADREHAVANGHLTARVCGEIATAAGVARLVPFHFSRRYADDPHVLFDELREACNRVLLPGQQALAQAAPQANWNAP